MQSTVRSQTKWKQPWQNNQKLGTCIFSPTQPTAHTSSEAQCIKAVPDTHWNTSLAGWEIQGGVLNIETCFWTMLEQFRAYTRLMVLSFLPTSSGLLTILRCPQKKRTFVKPWRRIAKLYFSSGGLGPEPCSHTPQAPKIKPYSMSSGLFWNTDIIITTLDI